MHSQLSFLAKFANQAARVGHTSAVSQKEETSINKRQGPKNFDVVQTREGVESDSEIDALGESLLQVTLR